jgi:hypothetical protein
MPIFFLLPMLFWVAVLGGGFYLAIRLVRALEGRSQRAPELDDVLKRMAQIEDTLESMNKRVERIGESQEFTTRLLTERSESDPRRGEGP